MGRSVFTIDQDRLDEEWVKQPDLALKWGKKLARCKRLLEEAKANVDVVAAELDKSIREDPAEFDLEKLTEPAIKQAIAGHKRMHKAHKAVIDRKYNVDLVQAVVTSIEHRKRALENLVELFSMSYFSDPKPKKHSKEASREWEKKAIRRKGRRGDD